MVRDSKVVYGASNKTNVLVFEPEKLHLVTDKTHPFYDKCIHLPVSEATVLNIIDQGVLRPIIAWKDPETGLSYVVDDRQRVHHILEANKRLTKEGKEPLLVPAATKRDFAIRMAQAVVSADEIRQADTPLNRTKKMADTLKRGHDENGLALMFGVSVQTIRAALSLLDVTQAVRDTVESEIVTVTQARQSGALPPEERRIEVAEIELAIAGAEGHEKARRQRQMLGEVKPRIKSRKEIARAFEDANGRYTEALRWALGEAQ